MDPLNPTAYPGHKDRTAVLRFLGFIILVAGIAAVILAPLEMYSFRSFAEGGRFYYEGFGPGSFMFGFIASQVVVYGAIAAVLMPLGYGHLALRNWARKLSLALLWSWLVIGAPVSLLAFFFLAATKEIPVHGGVLVIAGLALSYLVLPWVLIRFYNGRDAQMTFERGGPGSSWADKVPIPVLALVLLYVIYIVALNLLVLFGGIFPLFGTMVFGVQGVILIELSAAFPLLLTWGLFRLQTWAWLGSVVFIGALAVSTIITLTGTSYQAILSGLNFPPSELEFLAGVPAQGYHFAVLAGIPLVATWILVIAARRWFWRGSR